MRYVLVLAVLVAGCADGTTLSQVERECAVDKRPFEETWPCVRVGAAGISSYADVKKYYIAMGDVVAERVRAGTMTQAEARLAMAKARHEAVNAENSRNADLPAPSMPAPQRQIVCNRIGSQVICN